MTILVTGGLGVNGIWVVRSLSEKGIDVIAMDVMPESSVSNLPKGVRYVQGDVTDLQSLQACLAANRVDVIIHMGVIILADRDPYQAFNVNAMGTVNVLEAARRTNVRRVVYTSSRAVYGQIEGEYGHPTYKPLPEEYPRQSLSGGLLVYSSSKIFSEDAGLHYKNSFGLEFAALRFGTIYGPGKSVHHGPMALYSNILEPSVTGQSVRIPAGGDQPDDIVYVKDIAQGIVKAATVETLGHTAYNIGSGRLTTPKQYAEAVKSVIPDADIEVGSGLDPMGFGSVYLVMDIQKAESDLGYKPAFSLQEGVSDYIAMMRQ
ncbi:MAG: UDP-glucose 4-epimerase [Rhodothermales bacterium]|jgi:UDP-glucose 4-epimerase